MKQHSPVPIKSVLFVCLGNICRSPIAEGIFRNIAVQRGFGDQFRIESAGLGSWHIGSPPDERAQNALRLMGIDISHKRARRVTPRDFDTFDLILAMDRSNRNNLMRLAPVRHQGKIRLFLSYAPNLPVQEVPDPFFGNADGFDYVCQLVETACRALLVNLTLPSSSQSALSAKPGFTFSANG